MKACLRILQTVAVVTYVLLLTPTAFAGRLVEATFDEGPDGSGVADGFGEIINSESLIRGGWPLRFVGNAHRSAIDEGRYGRAAVFAGGGDAIELDAVGELSSVTLYAWVLAEDNTGGWLLYAEGAFGILLNGGELEIAVYDPTISDFVTFPSGMTIPQDGQFHHLIVYIDVGASQVTMRLDFTTEVGVGPLPAAPQPTVAPLVGYGFVGMIDELMIVAGSPNENDLFDVVPDDCADLVCLEEDFIMTPEGWGWEAPVRFKTVYDPTLCSATSPCPLVVWISGGFKCANDYAPRGTVRSYAGAGFVVVTVDPFCSAATDFRDFPTETSQLIAVKDYLFSGSSPLSAVIDPSGGYAAVGCSHGAGTISNWAVREDDYPARSFAISSGAFSGHCFYHSGMCLEGQQYADAQAVGVPWPHDDADPALYPLHLGAELVLEINEAIAGSREFGASWGVDTSPGSPICSTDGGYACFEEGLGFTYGGRRARDAWHAAEPAEPTGFFIENDTEDCRHCGLPAAMNDCVKCFLMVGRSGMSATCPECLALNEGEAAEECPLCCNETDGCVVGSPEMCGGDPIVPDPTDPIDPTDPGGMSAGCSCRLAAERSPEGLSSVMLLLVAVAVLALRRRSRRSAGSRRGGTTQREGRRQ